MHKTDQEDKTQGSNINLESAWHFAHMHRCKKTERNYVKMEFHSLFSNYLHSSVFEMVHQESDISHSNVQMLGYIDGENKRWLKLGQSMA